MRANKRLQNVNYTKGSRRSSNKTFDERERQKRDLLPMTHDRASVMRGKSRNGIWVRGMFSHHWIMEAYFVMREGFVAVSGIWHKRERCGVMKRCFSFYGILFLGFSFVLVLKVWP